MILKFTFNVTVGVVVWEYVDTLDPHFFDEVLENHGFVEEAPDGRFVATRELDKSNGAFANLKLGLDGSRTQSDHCFVSILWSARSWKYVSYTT